MKVFIHVCLCLVALLAGSRLATAQITGPANLGLENWATSNNVEKPVNWLTTDDVLAYLNSQPTGTFNFGTVTKTTDKHGGTYAAKLTNTNYVQQGTPYLLPGVLELGAKTGILSDPFINFPAGGAPLAASPTGMQFYYKMTGTIADSALVLAYLTGTVSGSPQIVTYGYAYLPGASSYTAQTVPFTYSAASAVQPDSVHVIFLSSTAEKTAVGVSLFIDDITFLGVKLATRASADVQALLTVAPNPSTGGRFVISSPAKPELAGAPWQVLDLAGRTVAQQAAQPAPSGSRDLDLSALSAGLYMLRLDTKEGTVVRQLTVK